MNEVMLEGLALRNLGLKLHDEMMAQEDVCKTCSGTGRVEQYSFNRDDIYMADCPDCDPVDPEPKDSDG